LAEAGSQVRFDPVYHGHYKCNFRTIRHGYPAIDLYAPSNFYARSL
jgi:glutathionyl-hydroquinone reductase